MKAWTRVDGGAETTLETGEGPMLAQLATSVASVLRAIERGEAHPTDPVVARLVPAAYADEDAAREFRELTAADLARERAARLEALAAAVSATRPGAPLTVESAAVPAWISALGDLRIVLHARLAQHPDDLDPDIAPGDLEQFSAVLDWLGFAQGTLIETLDSWREQ